MKPLVINVDMDGVLVHLTLELRVIAQELFKRYFGEPTEWSLRNSWNLSHSQADELWKGAFRNRAFYHAPAYVGGCTLVQSWVDAGHKVRLVTSAAMRTEIDTLTVRQDKLEWLYDHGLGALPVVFGGHDKTGIPADVVLDDKTDASGWAKPGALNLMVAQPWNERFSQPTGVFVHRVTLEEAAEAVRNLSEKPS
jgi:hypothetical protein